MCFKKRCLKITFITLIFILFSFVVCRNIALADINLSDKITPKDNGATDSFKVAMNIIVFIAQLIATGVAVIMLVALGIKYMVSSVNEKAEIKKHAVVYIVGAIIAFGSTGILQIFRNFITKSLK